MKKIFLLTVIFALCFGIAIPQSAQAADIIRVQRVTFANNVLTVIGYAPNLGYSATLTKTIINDEIRLKFTAVENQKQPHFQGIQVTRSFVYKILLKLPRKSMYSVYVNDRYYLQITIK